MNSTTPTEVQVVTEMDVYAASVRKVVSSGNLNASPLEDDSYSWSDVETEEQQKTEESQVQPQAQEQPPVQSQPQAQEQPVVQEEPRLSDSVNETLDRLMADILNIVNKENNIKVNDEVEADMPELGDSEHELGDSEHELGDSESEMPDLVSDTDSEMPDLVSESEDNNQVEESEDDNKVEESEDDTMIAVFKRPSCPRCEAALKVLLAHEEGNAEEESPEEEEHTYDSDESAPAESDTSKSDEDSDSDSDYVPSESESESPRTVRQLRRWNAERASDASHTDSEPVRTKCVPPLVQFLFTVLVVVHILKFLLNEPRNRIRCYS